MSDEQYVIQRNTEWQYIMDFLFQNMVRELTLKANIDNLEYHLKILDNIIDTILTNPFYHYQKVSKIIEHYNVYNVNLAYIFRLTLHLMLIMKNLSHLCQRSGIMKNL
jgi:hypothetical protein